jgi:alpha-beta hydrolase superfamily lysophospholipase
LHSNSYSNDVLQTAPQIAFYDAADGRRLALRLWQANPSPKARVVFLHGITSHGGWYTRSCSHFASAGFDVHFLDRRGSGLNVDAPGHIDAWTTWIEDVALYLNLLRGSQPVVLCGISWGGKLAAAVARRHPGLVQALGLICPGLYSPHEPGLLKRMALSTPLPERRQQRRVRIPLENPELFTDSPKWREFIARDPFTLRKVTWRFASQDRKLTAYARQAASFLHMPVLLMLAGRDRIVENRRTRAFLSRTQACTRSLIEYPNAAHTLEFESDPQAYFADLEQWFRSVAPK